MVALPLADFRPKTPANAGTTIQLARVEPLHEVNGRLRVRLQTLLLGDEQGAPDAGELSFLSTETLERVPLRALSVREVGPTLLIHAEFLDGGGAFNPHLVLVVRTPQRVSKDILSSPSEGVSGINYIARDFDAFRTLLLDRITALAPSWTDRTPADLGVMLAEVLAYLADNLSYYQDAVATEAYLLTARRRVSVRRHTRLLDYWLDQGVGARVWVRFDARDRVTIPKGTQLLAIPGESSCVLKGSAQYTRLHARATAVFETMFALEVRPELAEVQLWDGGHRHFVVPMGATSAIVSTASTKAPRGVIQFRAGDVLLFDSFDADNLPPQPVTLLHCISRGENLVELIWAPADALKRDFPVTQTVDGVVVRHLSVVRGNMVLADFGETGDTTLPARTTLSETFEPHISYSVVSLSAQSPPPLTPASLCTDIPANQGVPAIVLDEYTSLKALTGAAAKGGIRPDDNDLVDTKRVWTPVPDLLLSGPYSTVFVVESDESGCTLRFGDGVFGRSPSLGAVFKAHFRTGDPAHSNVGIGAISTLVVPTDDEKLALAELGLTVTNPLAATGGRAEETIAHAKQMAPALANEVRSAITLADYVRLAKAVDGIADAAAVLRWTGSWLTTFVYVRISAEDTVSALRAVENALSTARLAGRAIVVREPVWVALQVTLWIQLAPGFDEEGVHSRLVGAFVPNAQKGRVTPFFDPSRFQFGETVWGSAIVTWAKGVRGVATARLLTIAQVREGAAVSTPPEKLELAGGELPQVLNVPFRPETGTIVFRFTSATEVFA